MQVFCTRVWKRTRCEDYLIQIRRMPGEKDRSSSQADKATLALREMLVQRRFSPRDRLRESPLAAQLHESRIPLHLALERWAQENFL